jgi:hypothetical protein
VFWLTRRGPIPPLSADTNNSNGGAPMPQFSFRDYSTLGFLSTNTSQAEYATSMLQPDGAGKKPNFASTRCSLAKSMRDSPRRSRDPLPRRHKQEDPAQLRGLHLCDLSPRSPITSPTIASSSCTITGGIPTSSTARSPPTGAVFDFQVPFWHSAPEVAGCDQKDC